MLQKAPGVVLLKSAMLQLLTGDLSAGGWVPARERAVVMLEYTNDGHRITESQNGRGWKGPLWVI